MSRSIRIGTRRSPLALAQAESVQSILHRLDPELHFETIGITTQGDHSQIKGELSGKGDFITDIEKAVADQRADIAVHSMKDVPSDLGEEFLLKTIGEREDARDALVVRDPAFRLRAGVVVGSSSNRRAALLRHQMPDIEVRAIRGNVETRIAKLDEGGFDALILAAAGLKRLGLGYRIAQCLAPEVFVPAACQGIIAVQFLRERSDLRKLFEQAAHSDTETAAQVERDIVQGLGGDCLTPLGVYCTINERRFKVHAMVLAPDGGSLFRVVHRGEDPAKLVDATVSALLRLGADEVLLR